MLFKLENPFRNPEQMWETAFSAFKKVKNAEVLADFTDQVNTPQYLYWDKIRFKAAPPELTPIEFWAIVKFFRHSVTAKSMAPVRTVDGEHFRYQTFPWMHKVMHEVDLNLGGELKMSPGKEPFSRQQLISRGIIEEAIASSQLEGAVTTRKVAKQMLLEGRRPKTSSEIMIMNNYNAMRRIDEEFRSTEMTRNLLFELHAILTKDTIDAKSVGKLRQEGQQIVVTDPAKGLVYHVPPSTEFVDAEIERLMAYANDHAESARFEHPLIRAIVLHFWIGYLHPFVDGNGRLARALFYWYLLHHNYWAFAYLPLSQMIRKSPAQYRDAYVYSEQDSCDLTYFIDYNCRKIHAARENFHQYLAKKRQERSSISKRCRDQFRLNERQVQLLQYLGQNRDTHTSTATHARIYRISRLTARKDLESLEAGGLLSSEKIGRERPFSITPRAIRLLSKD